MTYYLYHDTQSGFAALVERPVKAEVLPHYRFVDSFEEKPDLRGKSFNAAGELISTQTENQFQDELARAMPSVQEQLDVLWEELGPAKTAKGRAMRQRIDEVRGRVKPKPTPPKADPRRALARPAKPMPVPEPGEPLPMPKFNPEPSPPSDPVQPGPDNPVRLHAPTMPRPAPITGDNRPVHSPIQQLPATMREKEQRDE